MPRRHPPSPRLPGPRSAPPRSRGPRTRARRRDAADPPRALREAARAFRRLAGADVVWLAVRESRSTTAVVRCTDGASAPGAAAALGAPIEAGAGFGGTALSKALAWRGPAAGDRTVRPSAREWALLGGEAVRHVLVVPLTAVGLAGEVRVEGVAYVGTRHDAPWSGRMLGAARRLGCRLGRPVRDAQRVAEATRRWAHAWSQLAASGEVAEHRLERIGEGIAADVRGALRSGVGAVFRLDTAAGTLQSVGVDWSVAGEFLPALRRGLVLPLGFGAAGRAIALRKTFVSADYVADVAVPVVMAAAAAALPPMASLSVPLVSGRRLIGALSVGRFCATPTMEYSRRDARLARELATAAAPLLARVHQAAERARRQHGASELTRLAGSLTRSLSVSAICDQLVQRVRALVHGTGACMCDVRGQQMGIAPRSPDMIRHASDPSLAHIVERVIHTGQPFWTPDLANDPRLAGANGVRSTVSPHARAVLVVPVQIRGTLLGLLGVAAATGRPFTAADIELAQALADQAAVAIANARAYDDLQISNVQLLRHEKLVAMGRLTSGLAHELRNPLQNVVGLTSELLERLPHVPPTSSAAVDLREYVRRAYDETKRAADIVDRLLDYVRERAHTFDTVDMRAVVADAVALAAGARGADVQVLGDDTPCLVYGDAIMLRQVTLNLLNNALDAVGAHRAHGKVEVRRWLERTPLGSGRVLVRVHDTGCGIAPAHLPHVFDLFFSTKEAGHGTGLGLAVCQSLIEQHGGRIRVDSPGVGRGTTVEFELPARR